MGSKSSSYIKKKSTSAVEDFKEFQIPKIVQICFLVLGILVGVGIAAFIKSSFQEPVEDIGEDFVEDDVEVLDEAISRPSVPQKKKEKERKPIAEVKPIRVPPVPERKPIRVPPVPVRESKTERKVAERSTARPAVAAQKPATQKPAPAVQKPAPSERKTQEIAEAPKPQPKSKAAEIVEAPKPQPKKVSLQGLTYDRKAFQSCSEDCLLIMRSASGQTMRVRLRKSLFASSLDRSNSRVDIDGSAVDESGLKTLHIENLRAHPKKEVPAEAIEQRVADEEEKFFEKTDAIPPAKLEKERVADPKPAAVAPKKAEPAAKRAQPNSLKNRLEEADSQDSSDEEESESSTGGSFQNRLRKSMR